MDSKMWAILLIVALAIWAIVSAVLVVAGYGSSSGTEYYSYATFGAAPIVSGLAIYLVM